MKVLVAAASRHGSTRQIAGAIAQTFIDGGIDVTVKDIADVGSLEPYDAAVLGSAVYAGHWLREARDFIHDHATELVQMPVWLFSSGPLGDPPVPRQDKAVDVEDIIDIANAREHRLFGGKLDKKLLSFGEKATVYAVGTPNGDWRDWGDIADWADYIASTLLTEEP